MLWIPPWWTLSSIAGRYNDYSSIPLLDFPNDLLKSGNLVAGLSTWRAKLSASASASTKIIQNRVVVSPVTTIQTTEPAAVVAVIRQFLGWNWRQSVLRVRTRKIRRKVRTRKVRSGSAAWLFDGWMVFERIALPERGLPFLSISSCHGVFLVIMFFLSWIHGPWWTPSGPAGMMTALGFCCVYLDFPYNLLKSYLFSYGSEIALFCSRWEVEERILVWLVLSS